MTWGEFSTLLTGLNADTVLGRVIHVRSSEDAKDFSPDQIRIRNEWQRSEAERQLQENPKHAAMRIQALQEMLAKAFQE